MESSDTETVLEIGKRPSRQRRHLPTSVTSAVNIRKSSSTDERQQIPLLKMSFREPATEKDNTTKPEATSTAYENSSCPRSSMKNRANAKTTRELKQKTQQFVEKSTVKTKRKWVLRVISAAWVLFMLYRIFISMQKEDFSNLSIVHCISNTIKRSYR